MTQSRRAFIKQTLPQLTAAGILLPGVVLGRVADTVETELTVAHDGFDGSTCWVHARAGIVPANSDESSELDLPRVIMTMQKLLLSGSDIFYALHETTTEDGGQIWSQPKEIPSFARQRVESLDVTELPTGAKIAPELLQAGDETTVCDFVPKWHASSRHLLGIGQTVWYRNHRVTSVRPRGIAYAVFDPERSRWQNWGTVELPQFPKFRSAGSGSVQRVDLPGGDMLLPLYFKEPQSKQYSVTVAHCRWDGSCLRYVRHGNEMTIAVDRGLFEPSLTYFKGRYYLTMRNDRHAYVSVSEDGLEYSQPRRWLFDNDQDLGSYNTQQHWVTHHENLYLVYTRRGADNDHVFRHRAPLFMGRVNPKRLCVERTSEQILVPEHGARLGNFGVVDISPHETWVTVTEWMQPIGVKKFGSDNRVFVAKLKWKNPNRRSEQQLQKVSQPASAKWYCHPPAKWKNDFGSFRSPLQRADGSQVKTPDEWACWRKELRNEWMERLGDWPPLMVEPQVETLQSKRRENFQERRLRFRWTPNEYTTGYLLIPDAKAPRPAVVTVYYEPETAIGQGKPNRDFAIQLARRGFATLSLGTSEATAQKTYSLYHPSLANAQVQPLSMLAYAAANAWYVLADQPEVDRHRIGIAGHSFGGKWAMFASCLFDKFACAAWSDPGIVFDEARPSVNYWEPWYLGYHPQPWRTRGVITPDNPAQGLYPELVAEGRDLHELHALMAPRPFLVSGGSEDPPERWQALNHSVEVNRLLGFSDRVAMTNRREHAPNADSNEVIYEFFAEHLDPG
ncbi:MAG: hypothetical protein CMJ77_02160 [Planctomycetaceae bacterium]|nr:hypothetical protein [Planctomycetaceae bacterium]